MANPINLNPNFPSPSPPAAHRKHVNQGMSCTMQCNALVPLPLGVAVAREQHETDMTGDDRTRTTDV